VLRVALTGVTGLLGRNLLMEIVKRNIRQLDGLEIVLLGRSSVGRTLQQRVAEIMESDGADYLDIKPDQTCLIREFFERNVRYLRFSLQDGGLGISPDDWQVLRSSPIDYFIHSAASTDMRQSAATHTEAVNFTGMKELIRLVDTLNVRDLSYISTAYVGRSDCGLISPDSMHADGLERNPYELSKRNSEMLFRTWARDSSIRCRVFRPSTICGRLVEQPHGSTCKYDVFYGWAAFFLREKMRRVGTRDDPFSCWETLDARVRYSGESGLNIIPADFAAKLIWSISTSDIADMSFHIANETNTPHALYIPLMLEELRVRGVKQVNVLPDVQNPLERRYYRTVGAAFTPYITDAECRFDLSNFMPLLRPSITRFPEVDMRAFRTLMRYAVEDGLGVVNRRIGASG